MSELDRMLLRLAAEPAPVLDGLDSAVMTGLGRRRERQVARRTLALAGGVAFFVGAARTLVPGAPASAEPLLGMPAAAPSHLLAN